MGATGTTFIMEDGTAVHADTTTYWGGIPEVFGVKITHSKKKKKHIHPSSSLPIISNTHTKTQDNHPEMGVLMVIPDDTSTDSTMFVPHYTDAMGRLYVLLYANRFVTPFDNMAQYTNPTTKSTIGIAVCSIEVLFGVGVAEIEVTSTETALATRVVSLVQNSTGLQRFVFWNFCVEGGD